jgi:phosphatidylserine decarboxylase
MSPGRPGIGDRLFVGMQYLLPQHLLSRMMHALARSRIRPLKNLVIRVFLRFYAINLAEAAQPDALAYESFNAFFTRALKPAARPIDAATGAVVSPVDGEVSQAGRIERDMLLQAKGLHYSIGELLGGDDELARQFDGGHFATLYLAPFDYHRIHMPLAGRLRCARHVKGDLFSVNAVTAATVPGLFARNERVACLFETAAGPMAVVLVGALFVGSISLAWTGELPTYRGQKPRDLPVGDPPIALDKAAELGQFNMGSTVILLFGAGRTIPHPDLLPGASVRMGQRIATLSP